MATLSKETFERIKGLVNQKLETNFIESYKQLLSYLAVEGFDDEDIVEYHRLILEEIASAKRIAKLEAAAVMEKSKVIEYILQTDISSLTIEELYEIKRAIENGLTPKRK